MDAEIIDLADIAAACGPIADWWDAFVANGEPRLPELERARRSLRRLAALPGSVGRAVRRLDIIDEPATDDLIGAVELLCKLARRNAPIPQETRPDDARQHRHQRKRPRAPESAQLLLPGLERP